MSLHMITHAVMLALLATLLKKYLQLMYQMEDLQDSCWKYSSTGNQNFERNIDDRILQSFHSFASCQCSLRRKHQVCHFKNICYEPNEEEFIYFYKENDDDLHFNDKKYVPRLSSPVEFTDHHMPLTYLNESVSSQFKIHWINKTSYIFHRFKSDNIMHVIHDDIIPLHYTMKHFESFKSNIFGKFDVQLLFMDDWLPGEYKILYELFTNSPPLYKKDIQKGTDLICFSNSVVGLMIDTLWYNYGFQHPQGKIKDSIVNGDYIKYSSQFILQNLNLEKKSEAVSDYIVLVSRRENRKILNENDLVNVIILELSMKVFIVGSETHSLTEMISLISNSRGIVGMHGSLLILSMFLKPGSFLLELFPYAVPAYQYTPYQILADLDGMDIIYKSWENMNPNFTVGHPDYPPEHGGIKHLSVEKQEEILKQTIVPKHLCCEDPSWLYHIYQDTFVDVHTLSNIFKEAISERAFYEGNFKHVETPSAVKTFECKMKRDDKCMLHIHWDKPWNVQYVTLTKLHYELLIEDIDTEDSMLYVVDETSLSLSVDCDKSYMVWARCVMNQFSYGSYINTQCQK